jgi:hypothetical protein
MSLIRSLAASVALTAAAVALAGAQGSISGSVYDSLSARAPLANATVVLVERSKYVTTDKHGRFTFDSVPDGRYTVGFMHAVLDSLDLQAPVAAVEVSGGRRSEVRLYTPSRATVAMTVMRARAAELRASSKQLAAVDSTAGATSAQALNPVTIEERATALTLMERDGFEQRRTMALGSFVTEAEIGKHGYSDLGSILNGTRGVRVDFTGSGKSSGIAYPMPRMLGVASLGKIYCVPNFFLDGAPYRVANSFDFRDLSGVANPHVVKGIEVYSNPGTIPAQYDMTSSTGCGSIVLWTR